MRALTVLLLGLAATLVAACAAAPNGVAPRTDGEPLHLSVRWLSADEVAKLCNIETGSLSAQKDVRKTVLGRSASLNQQIRVASGISTDRGGGEYIAEVLAYLPKKILELVADQLRREASRYTARFRASSSVDTFWNVTAESSRESQRLYDAVMIERIHGEKSAMRALLVIEPSPGDERILRLVPVYFINVEPEARNSGRLSVEIQLAIEASALEEVDRFPVHPDSRAGRFGHGLLRSVSVGTYDILITSYTPGTELHAVDDLRGSSDWFAIPRPSNPISAEERGSNVASKLTVTVTETDEGKTRQLLLELADLVDERSSDIVDVINEGAESIIAP